jgi:hypothetical protein
LCTLYIPASQIALFFVGQDVLNHVSELDVVGTEYLHFEVVLLPHALFFG